MNLLIPFINFSIKLHHNNFFENDLYYFQRDIVSLKKKYFYTCDFVNKSFSDTYFSDCIL